MITHNKETQELIDWLETEDCIDGYFSEDPDVLTETFHNLLFSGLNSRSIADTVNELIRITLRERVQWQAIIDYLKKRKIEDSARVNSEKEFMQWVTDNYESAGDIYWLSKNPNDYQHYELRDLRCYVYPRILGKDIKEIFGEDVRY